MLNGEIKPEDSARNMDLVLSARPHSDHNTLAAIDKSIILRAFPQFFSILHIITILLSRLQGGIMEGRNGGARDGWMYELRLNSLPVQNWNGQSQRAWAALIKGGRVSIAGGDWRRGWNKIDCLKVGSQNYKGFLMHYMRRRHIRGGSVLSIPPAFVATSTAYQN